MTQQRGRSRPEKPADGEQASMAGEGHARPSLPRRSARGLADLMAKTRTL